MHAAAAAATGPTSLWPSGQHGYPGLFLGESRIVKCQKTFVYNPFFSFYLQDVKQESPVEA